MNLFRSYICAQELIYQRDDFSASMREDGLVSFDFDGQENLLTVTELAHISYLINGLIVVEVPVEPPKPLLSFKLFGLTLTVGRAK